MLIRPATDADLDAVAAFPVDDPVGRIDAERFRAEYAERRFRPEWTWVAEDGGRIVARALWWGRSDSTRPVALDCLHVLAPVPDRTATAAALLAAGHAELAADGLPQYAVTLRDGWRSWPDVVAAVAWRTEAARRAGLTERVERLQVEWTAGTPTPATRLTFRAEPDDEVFVDAFRRIAVGSLDAATQRELPVLGAERQAREDVEFYAGCPGERGWWRLAYTADGALAGVAIPSATPYSRNVGYLGVLPELRGQGLIDEVLGEITRIHAADGAELITATTDTTNAPMAAAFARAGYRVTEIRLVHEAPPAA